MIAKLNVKIELSVPRKCKLELWDLDVLVDDLIQAKEILDSCEVELIFSLDETGESKPELQLRIYSDDGSELYRSKVVSTLDTTNVDPVTGFREVSTIDFGTIII